MLPLVVIRPILRPSQNQRLPSGPAVIPMEKEFVANGNSVIEPPGVIRPIFASTVLVMLWVNQILPSGPTARSSMTEAGMAELTGTGNSVATPAGVIRPRDEEDPG